MAYGYSCLEHLFKQEDFKKEFKDYVKNLYTQWAKQGINPQALGFPSTWANANRQINRMIARMEGRNVQSRSGRKAYDNYMHQWIDGFFSNSLRQAGVECLVGSKRGPGIIVGDFGGLYDNEAQVGVTASEYRGTFSDFRSLKNYAGELMATAPVFVAIVCGKRVYAIGSVEPDRRA